MIKTENNYCVILAGGKGRRLWPCSREDKPKQFIDFFGTGRTLLQSTYDRMLKIFPEDHIYINTNEEYSHYVTEQIPGLKPENMMAEPIHRNTAPSVAWATHRIIHTNPDANVVITPSDQMVVDDDKFVANVMDGLQFVSDHDCLLAMGVRPSRPEPGYGYIQLGDYTHFDDVYKVQSFIEKPDRSFATMFVESGEWYWNTGLFLSNVKYLGQCVKKILPYVLRNMDEVTEFSIKAEDDFIRENFASYPNLSIDSGILEKSENVCVKKCDFGWADVGTWHGIYEAKQKSEDDNVVIDSDVILEDAHQNVIKLPEGKLAVINGLEGFIVAEKDNVLLICKKEDSSALVRKYVNEVQMKKGESYI